MKRLLLSCMLAMMTFAGIAQTREIYVNPDFATLAKNHKTVAIMPFKTIIRLRPHEAKNMTPEQMAQLENDEGLAVQSALESYFLKRKDQHDLNIGFLDVNTTNALLAKHNVTQQNIDSFTPKELCDILGVDAIMGGILTTDKPMSEGASMALGVLVGFYGPTNSGTCTININDGATGQLL